MKHFLTFLIAFFLFFCSAVYSQVLVSDSLALVALYNQTGGASWSTKTNWLTGPVGNWYGVIRTGNRVTTLNLPNNNLAGSLPAAIGTLTAVTQLSLGNNKLSGAIPAEIGNMTNLKFLYLWGNQLTGSLPTTLSNLSNLEFLWVYSNQLTGSIPTSIGSIVSLKSLNLRGNQLDGAIPTSIGNLVNLEFLYLNNNILSGLLPDQLGNLTNLRELIINNNELSGDLPITMGGMTKLTRFIARVNKFSGSIPSSIGNLSALTHLDLQGNTLTGSIPPSIGSLTNLVELLLGNESAHTDKNSLTGPIPTSIGNLQSLVTFKVQDNKLSGQVPSEIGSLFNLSVLDLSNNEFISLPDLSGLPVLSSCDVRNNLITFKHIYGNRLLPNFLYSPQKATALTTTNPNQPTYADVGSDFLIELNDNTQGNVYQWFFNGNPITTVNSGSILIKPLNRATMGTYSCVVTNVNIAGLTFTFELKVDAVTTISGKLFTNLNQPALGGVVSLYEITTIGPYILRQQQSVTDGTYIFENVVLRDYLISGFADAEMYPGSIPTWYVNSILWEDADAIELVKQEDALNITSLIINSDTDGDGIITGNFIEPQDEGGRVGAKNKLSYGVSARRIQRAGRGMEDLFIPVAYTFTDENGDFSFENLEVGEYRLNIQFPGYPMDEESFIDIPIGDNVFTRQVGIQAEVLNQKIVIRKLVITTLDEEDNAVQVFPNPTNDFLFIKGVVGTDLKIELHNSVGVKQSIIARWDNSLQQWSLNLQALTPGVYFLTLSGGKTNRLRILIN